MTLTLLECRVCTAKATRFQLLKGSHISKSLCDLYKEVCEFRNTLLELEAIRDRLNTDIQALTNNGLDDNFVHDKAWLRYARRSFKTKIKSVNEQISSLRELKENLSVYYIY